MTASGSSLRDSLPPTEGVRGGQERGGQRSLRVLRLRPPRPLLRQVLREGAAPLDRGRGGGANRDRGRSGEGPPLPVQVSEQEASDCLPAPQFQVSAR